jgi:hypothetical protein
MTNTPAPTKAAERSCSGCVSCCRIWKIEVLAKEANQLCGYAVPGFGCSIHESKPGVCRRYLCGFMADGAGSFGDHWHPLQSGAVLTFEAFPNDSDPLALIVRHDPAMPFRLHEPLYLDDLKARTRLYTVAIVMDGLAYELLPVTEPAPMPAEAVADVAKTPPAIS